LRKSPQTRLKMARNFKTACPLGLKCLPQIPCPWGKPTFSKSGRMKTPMPQCEWYINSEKHNYCYWKYLNSVCDDKGLAPSLCYREIGNLLGVSSSTVGITVRKALNFLKDPSSLNVLRQMLDVSGGDPKIQTDPRLVSFSEDDDDY
jgi:hypothetical protein